MTVPVVLSAIGTAYLVLTYVASKMFPRAENVSSKDPRYYDSTTDRHAME